MRTLCFFGFFFLCLPLAAFAVSTPITYQGSLQEGGVPAEGAFDFSFQLRTAGGTDVGGPILLEDVPVVGGVFTVQLDFGANAFLGSDRRLGIAVRPGASAEIHTPLTPDTLLTAAPYALHSNNADTAFLADDVIDFAIDNVDVATGAIDARTLAFSSVGASEIATDAVGASEIATDAVGASEIAAGAVGQSELASNSVSVSKLIGANYVSPNNLTATITANTCSTFDVSVAGGFEPGDWVVLNATTSFPANVIIMPLEVVSTNVVKIRFCNNGSTSAAISNAGIRMMSFR